MVDLPPTLQRIFDAEAARPSIHAPHIEHFVHFVHDLGGREAELATFSGNGPIFIPAAGQVVDVHGVDVRCLRVDVSYETDEHGAPAVFATVHVESAE